MIRSITKRFFILALAALFAETGFAQQPAFPGAEGAGMYTTGGRGTTATPTTVFEVTNLTDVNSPGSLRYALSQSTSTYPHRTVVFRVSGTIHLNSRLNVPRNTTIAGQTAPGDGICIADHPVVINGDNVIIRYLRIRLGDKNQLKTSPAGCGVPVAPFTAACMPIDGSGGDDALGNLSGKHIIIDHCSISWSADEALTVYRGDSVTMQWNFIEEPLNYSYHYESPDTDFQQHGYGGIWGSKHGSFHHNLIAHCRNRTPRFAGNSTYGTGETEQADFRNNVLYNWGINNIYGGDGGNYNLVNNYYKYGPNTSSGVRYRIVGVDSSATYGWAKYYLSGNYVDGSSANTANNWSGAAMLGGNAADSVKSKSETPFLSTYPQVTTETAQQAYESVLRNAGAILPRRDTMDQRIVNDVRFRVGGIKDVQGGYPHGTPYAQTANAWPTLNSTTAPVDSDHDGMPDDWEVANGLNPNNAADRQIVATNGYTNLENYLNGITNISPEVEFTGVLSPFTQNGATPSAAQTIQVSGFNLSGNVQLTAPAGFELSIDGGSTWHGNANPIQLNTSGGMLAAVNLSIRLNKANTGSLTDYLVATTSGASAFHFALNGNRTNTPVNNAASVVWPLLNNQDPVITGAVSATNQVFAPGVTGVQYGSGFGGTSGWQRSATTSFLPVGYSANTYLEYSVTPAPGKTFVDTAIVLSALGGGTGTARMAIYYSKDGFATSQSIGPITYNGISYSNSTNNTNSVSLLNTSTASLTGQQIARATTNISVAPGETLTIRVYPWITGSGNRYFASQNVTLMGYTTGNNTLPLRMILFTASLQNRTSHLAWETTDERSTDKFEIESSSDGSVYRKIGTVASQNRSGNNRYHFADPELVEAPRFYRLKLMDNDGKFSYSKVVFLNPRTVGKIAVYPNPATSSLLITYPPMNVVRHLRVVAADGRILQQVTLQANTTQQSIDVTPLIQGQYFIHIDGKEQALAFSRQ